MWQQNGMEAEQNQNVSFGHIKKNGMKAEQKQNMMDDGAVTIKIGTNGETTINLKRRNTNQERHLLSGQLQRKVQSRETDPYRSMD